MSTTTYAKVNREAQLFTRPTKKMCTKQLHELLELEQEQVPQTIRYSYETKETK